MSQTLSEEQINAIETLHQESLRLIETFKKFVILLNNPIFKKHEN